MVAKNDRGEAPLCECGCGKSVTWCNDKRTGIGWNKYVHGHNARTPEMREKSRKFLLALWEDDEYRKRRPQQVSEEVSARWADREFRAKMKIIHQSPENRERCRQGGLKVWTLPGFRESQERMWNDPDYKQFQREKTLKQWEDPEFQRIHRERFEKYWEDPKFVEEMKSGWRTWFDDPKNKEKMRERGRAQMQKNKKNPEYEKKRKAALNKKWEDPVFREEMHHKFSAASIRKWQDPVYREKLSRARLAMWRDPAFLEKILAANRRRPNKPESLLDQLTGSKIRYVGNGSWWRKICLRLPNGEYIEKNKNPDFKVTGENKVIEIWGSYWHRGEIPEDLIMAYKGADLDALIIWDEELYEDPEAVLDRVAAFVGEEAWQMSLPV